MLPELTVTSKWPKTLPPLTEEQQRINDDFVKYWHEVLPRKYGLVEAFNHEFAVKNAPKTFRTTLEIGAGLGEHLNYEVLTPEQKSNYYALELRENMAEGIRKAHPDVNTVCADCQARMPFEDGYFDRILAVHVLEHLPNLPAALDEIYRLCNKKSGTFSVVIPCEGGLAYSLARRISAQRIFESRYKMPYDWFYKREHINFPVEIQEEILRKFDISSRAYFPLLIPSISMNLCIGLTATPRASV
jgi:SAM-dependent methyltransferase